MTKTKSIALAGLFAAIHVIALLMLHFEFLVGVELIILFAVPFFSAIYSYKAKPIYCISYFVATMLICLIIDPANTLLYILPTLVVGLSYGFLVKKNVDGNSIVYILTILEFGLFWLSGYLVSVIFDYNYIETITYLLHFSPSSKHLGLGFLLLYCFAQSFLIHIVTKNELKKIKVNVKKTTYPSFINFVLGIASLILAFIPFDNKAVVVLMLVCAIIFNIPLALYGYQITSKPWVIIAVQVVVFLVVTLPLLLSVYKDSTYEALGAYLILFIPPIVHGAFDLFSDKYVIKNK